MLSGGEVPDGNPTIMVEFRIPQYATSGLKVSRLDLYGEVRESSKFTTRVPITS